MNRDDCLHGVLVVDDEILVLKYTLSVVASFGFSKVFKATNAEEARAILVTEQVSLIVSDISLPDADGRDLIREAFALNPAAFGLLITGFDANELTIPSEISDRVKLLSKPFLASDIRHAWADFDGRLAPATLGH